MPEHICKTVGCFAGWRAFRDGYVYQGERRFHGIAVLTNAAGYQLAGGGIATYAQIHLELTDDEADHLFEGTNDLACLKEIVDLLCAQQDRSEESKRKLRETMDDVLAAEAEGLWDQYVWAQAYDGDDHE